MLWLDNQMRDLYVIEQTQEKHSADHDEIRPSSIFVQVEAST